MSGFIALVLALAAGAALGLVYFGGLWLTVRQLAGSGRPALLFGASLLVRTLLTVLGFYLVMDASLARVLACLLGFIIARQLLVSRLRPGREPVARRGREGARP